MSSSLNEAVNLRSTGQCFGLLLLVDCGLASIFWNFQAPLLDNIIQTDLSHYMFMLTTLVCMLLGAAVYAHVSYVGRTRFGY